MRSENCILSITTTQNNNKKYFPSPKIVSFGHQSILPNLRKSEKRQPLSNFYYYIFALPILERHINISIQYILFRV